MTEPLLRMEYIIKRFPGVLALDDVSLEILPGETHGLLGENGAGKSTLLKILSGAYAPDAGTITLGGTPLRFKNPIDAQKHGIITIYQEFNLIPTMTVAENMFLCREPGSNGFVSWSKMRDETAKVLQHLNLSFDPMTPVSDLSVGEQQMVEIARALSRDSRIIVMDEPTAALTEREVEHLFRIIADLKARGLSIIYVTHRLNEVEQICDRVTVLRDGKRVGGGKVGELKVDDFVKMMVGRSSSQLFTRLGGDRSTGPVVMTVKNISRDRDPTNPHATLLKDVSLEVRAGEILGLAGLMGAGRTELARAIFGADPFGHGTVEIDGKPLHLRSPADAIRHGIGLVPEDRKQQALFLDLAIRHNLAISNLKALSFGRWFVSDKAETALVERFRKALDIRMASPDDPISGLSGGNQQKVVLARWLALKPKVLIVDEPTRGIDIAAKAEVHQQLDLMARAGIAIIAISSELPEVMAISDRIITMREGRVTGTMPGARATEESLMHLMAIEQPSSTPIASAGPQ
ncbi:sugar ABC transporter ATP-binding protein [Dongia sedimenti]|uniref:Sugar ABC transporter ATP-binding protein n=1 Tax=Dongia sedimenti TaxID=3064282 RepID=A0ABU0YQ14_9PROT|nr:sugar ABC transporter ATP-binding protein [Rhodospirillaceae bacterium R-7]